MPKAIQLRLNLWKKAWEGWRKTVFSIKVNQETAFKAEKLKVKAESESTHRISNIQTRKNKSVN